MVIWYRGSYRYSFSVFRPNNDALAAIPQNEKLLS